MNNNTGFIHAFHFLISKNKIMKSDNFTFSDMSTLCYNLKIKVNKKFRLGIHLLTFCCCLNILSAQNTFFVSSNNQQAVGVFEVSADGLINEFNWSIGSGIY